jgi:hypothetical protein
VLTGVGLTLTDATGAAVTVIADVPLFPSLVAVSVAVPGATPVTKPLALTVAIPELLLAHVTTRPLKTPPVESSVVGVSCTVCPTVAVADAGLMLTDATGTAVTSTTAESLSPARVLCVLIV